VARGVRPNTVRGPLPTWHQLTARQHTALDAAGPGRRARPLASSQPRPA